VLGAKVKQDWAKPRISPFRRQCCSSITRHWHEFFKILALQYQGTMQPHACASWLKCPSYAAPVESAKGGHVGDRVPCAMLINRHLVIARLLHSLMAPVSSSFQKIPARVQYLCIYRRFKSASVCKPPDGFNCLGSRLPGHDQRSTHLRSSRSPAYTNKATPQQKEEATSHN